MAHLAVVGAGAWGTALAILLADAEPVRLWSRDSEHARQMSTERRNQRYLPTISAAFPEQLEITDDLKRAVSGADCVLMAVPSHAYRGVLRELAPLLGKEARLVNATKGIEEGSLMLMHEVVEAELGAGAAERYAVLSGPSFAEEVATQQPTNIVMASKFADTARELQQRFARERFRVYSSEDPLGVEVGGALKNVIAIAAGACDSLFNSLNTRAALITRGLAELSRLAQAKQASPMTLAGLAGMGDLVLTCTGRLSRNFQVGQQLGQGKSLDEVLAGLGHVAEGVKTARSAYDLAQSLGVELPLCFEVYRVLYEGKPPLAAVESVLQRPLKSEF